MSCFHSHGPTSVQGYGEMFFTNSIGNLEFVVVQQGIDLGTYHGETKLGTIKMKKEGQVYSFVGFEREQGEGILEGEYLKITYGTNQWVLKMETNSSMVGTYSPTLNPSCVPDSNLIISPGVEGFPKIFGRASWSPSGEVICQVDMTLIRKDEIREYVYYNVDIRPVLCVDLNEELMEYALLRLFLGIFMFGKYDVELLKREWYPCFIKRLKSGCFKKYLVFFENCTWTSFC